MLRSPPSPSTPELIIDKELADKTTLMKPFVKSTVTDKGSINESRFNST